MARWSTLFVVLAILVGVFDLGDLASPGSRWGRTALFVLLGLGAACLALERAQRDR